MTFLLKLTEGIPALLLFAILMMIAGPIWTGLHGEPGGSRGYYVFPILALIVVIVLVVAWVRLVF